MKKKDGMGFSYISDLILMYNNKYRFFLKNVGGPEKGRYRIVTGHSLSTFSSDSASQLDVLWHDGDSLGVDGTQVGIFKQTNQVGFAGFLEGHDG